MPYPFVRIWLTTRNGQIPVGRVAVGSDGKVIARARPGHETMMRSIASDSARVRHPDGSFDSFDPKRFPRQWLRALPWQYTGSMVRAEYVRRPSAKPPGAEAIGVGDTVVVRGIPGRGVVTKIAGTRVTVHFRNGWDIEKDRSQIARIGGRVR